MKKDKLNLSRLKISSFMTQVPDKAQWVKGGLRPTDPANVPCRYSFGGINTACNTRISLCEHDFTENRNC